MAKPQNGRNLDVKWSWVHLFSAPSTSVSLCVCLRTAKDCTVLLENPSRAALPGRQFLSPEEECNPTPAARNILRDSQTTPWARAARGSLQIATSTAGDTKHLNQSYLMFLCRSGARQSVWFGALNFGEIEHAP
jgi:hypothetical protein